MDTAGQRRAFTAEHIIAPPRPYSPVQPDASSDTDSTESTSESTPILPPVNSDHNKTRDSAMSSATQRFRRSSDCSGLSDFAVSTFADSALPQGSANELAYLKKIADLELTIVNLKCQLVQSSDAQARRGRPDDDVELGSFRSVRPPPARPVGGESFAASMYERGSWLTGLLIFQSFSSFILVANEGLLASHPDIIFFLTMLVGAGGNAGNQAAVRVIRGLAVGSITPRGRWRFLRSELGMALALSCFVGLVGCARAVLSFRTSPLETLAITVALVTIIFISVVTGSVLPFVLQYFKFDPAHSSTSIQVIMDILGVLITCAVATSILGIPDLTGAMAGAGSGSGASRGELPRQPSNAMF